MKKLFKLSVLSFLFASVITSCDNDDIADLSTTITAFIETKYPGAVIHENDNDFRTKEVTIFHNNIEKDVQFDKSDNWQHTSWDIVITQLPQEVTDAVKESKYSTYRLDDAEYYETPVGDYYELELEEGNREVKIRVNLDGIIL